jgi:hypothetical protein
MTAWPAENKLAAPYHVFPAMTGFEELDLYGSWDTVPDCGAVWYPSSVPAEWAPCRDGQWVWVEPWGWTWVDAGLWGFAPLHYGPWARIDDRWGWVPGTKSAETFVADSPLEEAGFEPSVLRQGTAFFTEGNELYPLPINHQAGDRASGEKRLSRGRRNRCQRLRSLH